MKEPLKTAAKLHIFREYSYLSSNENCLLKKEFRMLPDWVVNKNYNKALWLFTNNCYSHITTPGVLPSCSCRWLFPPWAAQQEERVKLTLPNYPCLSAIWVWKRLGNDNKLERVQRVLPSFVWHMKRNNISHQEKNRHSKRLLSNKDSMCNLIWLFLLPSIDILERFESRESKWSQF